MLEIMGARGVELDRGTGAERRFDIETRNHSLDFASDQRRTIGLKASIVTRRPIPALRP